MDKHYLSFGGGVNSVAMLLLLLEKKEYDSEVVFVDTGCEYPETYEYVDMVNKKIFPVTILRSADYTSDKLDLYEHCIKYRMVPIMQIRWCTSLHKIKPLHTYFEKPCFVDIGIATEEAKRQRVSTTAGLENCYPLIEHGISRDGCIDIISAHGLPIPRKSGCSFVPCRPRGRSERCATYTLSYSVS